MENRKANQNGISTFELVLFRKTNIVLKNSLNIPNIDFKKEVGQLQITLL